MKWILRLGIAVVLVLVLVAVGLYFYLDVVAKRAIERGGSYATGVPTTVDSVSLAPLRGELRLGDLKVANPEGFNADHFFTLTRGEVDVTLGSLMSSEVVIPRVELDGLHMNLEMQGEQANYQVILENLERLSGPADQQPVDQRDARRYVINELILTDINVQATLRVLGGEPRTVPVKIAEIRLTDVGSDTENGVLLSQVQGIVIQAVLEALATQGDLPTVMLAGLRSELGELGDIGGVDVEGILTDVLDGGGTDRLREEAGRVLEDAAGEDVGRTLDSLLGGSRNDKPQE